MMRRIVAGIAEALAAKSPSKLALFGGASHVAARGTMLFVAAGAASVILVNGMLVRVERRGEIARRAGADATAMMAVAHPGAIALPPTRDEAALMAWLGLDRPFSGMPFEASAQGAASATGSADIFVGSARPLAPFETALLRGGAPVVLPALGDLLAAGDAEDAAASAQRLADLTDGTIAGGQFASHDAGLTDTTPPAATKPSAEPEAPVAGTPAMPLAAAPGQSIVPTAPVPEPAIWLQLIGGFGAIGFLLRRRNRRLPAAPRLR